MIRMLGNSSNIMHTKYVHYPLPDFTHLWQSFPGFCGKHVLPGRDLGGALIVRLGKHLLPPLHHLAVLVVGGGQLCVVGVHLKHGHLGGEDGRLVGLSRWHQLSPAFACSACGG